MEESKLFGVSLRGWIAASIVITVCGMSAFGIEIKEPLYTLVISAVSFYFGKMSNPNGGVK